MTGPQTRRPIEDTLVRALADTATGNVPLELTPPGPPDRVIRSASARRARWTFPLLAAAAVIAVVTGSVVVASVAGDRRSTPPATQAPFPTGALATTPGPGVSTTPQPAPTTPATTPAGPVTRYLTYRPFTAAGAPAHALAPAHLSGYCWTSSMPVAAAGAYRCFAGAGIYDPCFASGPKIATGDQVYCVATPWSPMKALTLTRPLPAGGHTNPSIKWAFELDNGARCLLAEGTTDKIDGVQMGLQCDSSVGASAEPVPGADSSHLTAYYASSPDGPLHKVRVREVWTAAGD